MLSDHISANSPFHIDQHSFNLVGASNQRHFSYADDQREHRVVEPSQALTTGIPESQLMYCNDLTRVFGGRDDQQLTGADVYLSQMEADPYGMHCQPPRDFATPSHVDPSLFRNVESVAPCSVGVDCGGSNNRSRRGQSNKFLKSSRSRTDLSDDVRPCKSRRRNMATAIPSNPVSSVDRVFVWDLDETVIVFQTLLSGEYARKNNKDAQMCVNLGLQMEDLIFYLCDNFFFLKDLEDCDQMHIDDMSADDSGQDLRTYDFNSDGLSTINAQLGFVVVPTTALKGNPDWTRKVALRLRRVKELVSCSNDALQSLLPSAQYERWLRLRCEIEQFTGSWTALAKRALSNISHRADCVNLLVTSTHLIPAIAKLMLFGLNNVLRIENVYSAAKSGKEKCFAKLSSSFDRKTTFIAIGDGQEEEQAAKNLNWPFWRVSSHSDLMALNCALENDFL